MRSFTSLFLRDLRLAWRGNGAALAVGFFFIAVALVPFGIGPDLNMLQKIAPGLVWVSLVLAELLSLEQMFQADIEDGSFDQFMLAGTPLEMLAMAKGLAHWVGTVLPLVLLAPLAGLLLNIHPDSLFLMLITLLAGSPAMSFLGMMGSALSAGVARGGLLAALIVMPLYVPVLIFGSSALSLALAGDFDPSALAVLVLLGLASLCLGPVVAAAGLRTVLR